MKYTLQVPVDFSEARTIVQTGGDRKFTIIDWTVNNVDGGQGRILDEKGQVIGIVQLVNVEFGRTLLDGVRLEDLRGGK